MPRKLTAPGTWPRSYRPGFTLTSTMRTCWLSRVLRQPIGAHQRPNGRGGKNRAAQQHGAAQRLASAARCAPNCAKVLVRSEKVFIVVPSMSLRSRGQRRCDNYNLEETKPGPSKQNGYGYAEPALAFKTHGHATACARHAMQTRETWGIRGEDDQPGWAGAGEGYRTLV